MKSVFDIKPDELKEKGIKGIITDLDNTLVAWDVRDATEEIVQWFKKMTDNNLKVTIISNNKQERVQIFSDPLNIPFVHSARKPLRKSFNQATEQMDLQTEEVVVIGDQVLTDVLGGNRAGFYTILVVPIVETDAKITKINRFIERKILNYFRKRGKIDWEDS